MKKALLVLFCLVAASMVVVGYQYRLFAQQSIVTSGLFKVSPGDTAPQLIRKLIPATDKNKLLSKLYLKLNPQFAQVKAGTFYLPKAHTLSEALTLLVEGKEHLFDVTLVEGLTWRQWHQQICAESFVDCDGFDMDLFVANNHLAGAHVEGWLMPDTYRVADGTKLSTLVTRSLISMQEYLPMAWATREFNLPIESPYQALILASIVEKETGIASERPLIAGVFVNRLRLNMRLQTDPTVIYGIGESFNGDLTRADLREPTPYNTYVIKGLPPTPIAMVSKQAIQAVLHPAETESLYFVSKGDGSHYFSKTLQEHNRAVRQYQLKQE